MLMLLSFSVGAPAQPPVLLTEPASPIAGQPFAATLRMVDRKRLGISQHPTIEIVGNTIRIPFNTSCPFLCPPIEILRDYGFQMPALPAGTYTVVFYEHLGDPASIIAQMPLNVSGAPLAMPVPAVDSFAVALLIMLLLVVAKRRKVASQYH